MRILYVGESWLGSCARSLKEALCRQPDVAVDEVNEDLVRPISRARLLRAAGRLLAPWYRRELEERILAIIEARNPHVVVAYKGWSLSASFIDRIKRRGPLVVNVFPDCSPHAHGRELAQAMGHYDLVLSTKVFHPTHWQDIYGYSNACAFVPQGYDPLLHLASTPPESPTFDVAMVATWRPEYEQLMQELGRRLTGKGVTVGIGGCGWHERADRLPSGWTFAGELTGHAYVEWLRRGRVCLAPVTRLMRVAGVLHPGDEDSTRTYELAAAHCFFLHRRTPYVKTVYDSRDEVPMFDDAAELAEKLQTYLKREDLRQEMAKKAHQRAVPAYSLDHRAASIIELVKRFGERRETFDHLPGG
jgi:glycosyltransferase involved in cell wall biosynthesis